MGEAKEIWKRLFFVLHNNKQPDDDLPTMWTPFKAGNLQDDDLKTAIQSISHLLPDNVKEKLNSLCSANKTSNGNVGNYFSSADCFAPRINPSQSLQASYRGPDLSAPLSRCSGSGSPGPLPQHQSLLIFQLASSAISAGSGITASSASSGCSASSTSSVINASSASSGSLSPVLQLQSLLIFPLCAQPAEHFHPVSIIKINLQSWQLPRWSTASPACVQFACN